jgi:hypothetical protein
VRRQQVDGERALDGQRAVLLVVVVQDEPRDVVGHAAQACVALLLVQLAPRDQPVEHDLDVDLVVAAVDARRVVDGVGVQVHPAAGGLDAAALGQPEVAALADDPHPQLGAVDAHGVVGLVADRGVRLRGGLDVRADAPVPEQVDRCLQDGADELVGAERAGALRQAEPRGDRRADRDGLRLARVDATARAQQAGVVVGPRRAGEREQPLPLAEGDGRVGVGVEEDVAVVEGRDEADVLRQQHAVAEDVPAHVADADDRDVGRLRVDAELAEVAPDALPRPAGR